jgi:transposase-like protein
MKKPSQAMSRHQLARAYGISVNTLRRWFAEKNVHYRNRILTPSQLEDIIRLFGEFTHKSD